MGTGPSLSQESKKDKTKKRQIKTQEKTETKFSDV